MLSPHEIAALMLLENADGTLTLDPADLKSLVRRQLVQLERLTNNCSQVRLTNHGRDFLDTVIKRR